MHKRGENGQKEIGFHTNAVKRPKGDRPCHKMRANEKEKHGGRLYCTGGAANDKKKD